MTTRDTLFSKIRTALEPVAGKPAYPDFDDSLLHSAPRLAGSPVEAFTRNFTAVNGRVMRSTAELAAFLQQHGQTRGYCDPVLMDPVGNALLESGLTVETTYDRARYDDYQFGLTRATMYGFSIFELEVYGDLDENCQ